MVYKSNTGDRLIWINARINTVRSKEWLYSMILKAHLFHVVCLCMSQGEDIVLFTSILFVYFSKYVLFMSLRFGHLSENLSGLFYFIFNGKWGWTTDDAIIFSWYMYKKNRFKTLYPIDELLVVYLNFSFQYKHC